MRPRSTTCVVPFVWQASQAAGSPTRAAMARSAHRFHPPSIAKILETSEKPATSIATKELITSRCISLVRGFKFMQSNVIHQVLCTRTFLTAMIVSQ